MSAKEFARVTDVNLEGVHFVIRAFFPDMIQKGRGVVVNFSSGLKYQHLPAGLAAVALNPGIIDTRMLCSCFGEGAGSYPTPEKRAKVAVPFLASLVQPP